MTTGTWRSSSDTVFLSTPVQPRILSVDESIEDRDSITIAFSDKYNWNITKDVHGIVELRINGIQQNPQLSLDDSESVRRFLEPYLSNKVAFKRIDQYKQIATIDFLFDRVTLAYTVKNPNANSFHFVLNLMISDLWTERPFIGQKHFFQNEPLLFLNDSYCLHHDFHCFYSPEPDSNDFNVHRPLTRD